MTVQPSRPRTPAFPRRSRSLLGLLVGLLGLLGPVAGSVGAPIQVFAEFGAEGGDGGAPAVREARLFIDGVELSDRSTVGPYRISYVLPADFPTGTHEARVLVVDALGRTHEKSWSFEHDGLEPELVAFFTDELFIELDPLPRTTTADRVRLSGRSLPEVEIAFRLDGRADETTLTSASGRFQAVVELEPGDQLIGVVATRPWTGEEGRELRVRLERRIVADVAPPTDQRRVESPTGFGRTGRDAPPGPVDRTLPGGAGDDGAGDDGGGDDGGGDDGGGDDGGGDDGGGDDGGGDDGGGDDGGGDDGGDTAVTITHPREGDHVRNDRVTVLGTAPPHWLVEVLVDGQPGGSDRANPAGRFTIPQVALAPGANELVAEAVDPQTGERLRSVPVVVIRDGVPKGVMLASRGRVELSREGSFRLEGRAWTGALLEIELNGRLVATEVAGLEGRFSMILPLERGLNRIVVEAFDLDSGLGVRSSALTVRSVAPVRRSPPAVFAEPLIERPGKPGQGGLGRLRPLN